MKVLYVVTRLNIGGPARHVVTLGGGLAARGVDTLLVHGRVDDTEGSFEHLPRERGLRTLRLDELGRSVRWGSDTVAFLRLLRVIFAEKPDIVHTHTAKAGALGRLAAAVYNATRRRRRRCVVVHTFHGHVFIAYFGAIRTALIKIVERCLSRITDRVVALSDIQKRELVQRFRIVGEAQVTVVPLGLELDTLLQIALDRRNGRQAFGFSPSDRVIGYVGRFVPIKGLESLVRAFAIVAGRAPNVKLLLVGDGERREPLEALADSLGVGPATVFAGWREDLATVYGAIDVAAVTSLNEGTPVALVEAMAAGRPVVATAVGGVPDVVVNGVTGFLVPTGDPSGLADALQRLIDDAALAGRMGDSGRRHVAQHFHAERLVSTMHDLYRTELRLKQEAPVRTASHLAP
jgi:glycosyltransferase involved in cell wall biosynthesis